MTFHKDLLQGYFSEKTPKNKAKEQSKEPVEKGSKLEKYQSFKEKSRLIEVTIPHASRNGDLNCDLDNGVKGIIPHTEVADNYNPRQRSKYVNQTMHVAVHEIDEENNTVILSKKNGDKIKSKLIRNYVRNYKPGMKAQGKLMFYNKDNKRIYIDLGAKFLGYIPVSLWANNFVHDIEQEVEDMKAAGDVIVDVIIQEYKPRKGRYEESFICSRKDAMPNPWEGIEEKYHRNDIIIGVCNDMQKEKFYCPLNDGSEIDVYCQYPEDQKDTAGKVIWKAPKIKIGGKYKLRVYDVNEEKKVFRARVIDEVLE